MPKTPKKPVPLKLRSAGKTDVRAQFAALCYRFKGGRLQVCIVTTRNTGRWILPRGWPTHKQTAHDGAAIEAFEEAGVTGQVFPDAVGTYVYDKPIDDGIAPVLVVVYAIHAVDVAKKWPEKKQRKRRWVSLKKAAAKLQEPGLKHIVASFDPARLDVAPRAQ
ncbi:MAG: NUDIX hydrolase [Yoonia sp.]|jgi:8-oxo-dGTP pyrophosphatase MutT (NUDIX family)|nr:NUDIX hydrolase [Yoonia sp.]